MITYIIISAFTSVCRQFCPSLCIKHHHASSRGTAYVSKVSTKQIESEVSITDFKTKIKHYLILINN